MDIIQPSFQEEMQYLEMEVLDEMNEIDTEASFTTQRKVFKFLVNDHNTALTTELTLYRETMEKRLKQISSEIGKLRDELDSVNLEN